MTEKRIRMGRTIWPWIVAALVVVAIIIYILLFDIREEEDEIKVLPETGMLLTETIDLSIIKLDINCLECHKFYCV